MLPRVSAGAAGLAEHPPPPAAMDGIDCIELSSDSESDSDDIPLAQLLARPPASTASSANLAPASRQSSSSAHSPTPSGPSGAKSRPKKSVDTITASDGEEEDEEQLPDEDDESLPEDDSDPRPRKRRRSATIGSEDEMNIVPAAPRIGVRLPGQHDIRLDPELPPGEPGARGRPRRAAAAKAVGAYALKKGKQGADKQALGGRSASADGPRRQAGRAPKRISLPPFVPVDDKWTATARDAWMRAQARKLPHERSIVGPAWEGELSTELTDCINWARMDLLEANPLARIDTSQDDLLFEQMVNQVTRLELGSARDKQVRIIPSNHGKDRSPPFELVYTHRVPYVGPFLPVPPLGCGCIGNCADLRNFGSCRCRQRQEEACTTRADSLQERSGHKGFAYDENGLLDQTIFQANERVIECNAQCGCDDSCQNRVVGHRPAVAVDLFHTDHAGWAVRNPESYEADPNRGLVFDYEGRTIKRGAALGIYSGELLPTKMTYERDECYDLLGRNYLYELDTWTTAEEIGFFEDDHEVNLSDEAKEKYTAAFVIDAFSYGNWTRFCNHKCNTFNATPRPVQVDDADPRRPLWVFFATQDILPGEEITIAYHDEAAGWEEGQVDVAVWKEEADARRRLSSNARVRCYCNDALCFGVFFVYKDEVVDDEVAEPAPQVEAELAAVGSQLG